jgi:hypothetical protein
VFLIYAEASLMSNIYSGNAIIDGRGGWFFGDRQPAGPRHHNSVLVKYGLHHTGEECKNPHKCSKNINISILIDGGPFVHYFRTLDTKDLPDVVLERIGDYVIYGPDVTHTWRALKESSVVTFQFPP